jgi:hypothetical protein
MNKKIQNPNDKIQINLGNDKYLNFPDLDFPDLFVIWDLSFVISKGNRS